MVQDKYRGWLSDKSIADFAAYAEMCFKAFGDRVSFWTTFNEPWSFIWIGHDMGTHAPGGAPASKPPSCMLIE